MAIYPKTRPLCGVPGGRQEKGIRMKGRPCEERARSNIVQSGLRSSPASSETHVPTRRE